MSEFKFVQWGKNVPVDYQRLNTMMINEQYLKDVNHDPTKITKDYVRNSSLLINLAKAIGRIVVSYKDMQNLAGYTTLIHEMDEVLDDLRSGTYVRTQVVEKEINNDTE